MNLKFKPCCGHIPTLHFEPANPRTGLKSEATVSCGACGRTVKAETPKEAFAIWDSGNSHSS
jgi:hypothetical protein